MRNLESSYFPSLFSKWVFSLFLLTHLMFIQAIYNEMEFRRIVNEEFILCFYGNYMTRPIVGIVTFLELLFSLYFLRRQNWELPKSKFDLLLIFNPLLIIATWIWFDYFL